MSRIGAPSKCTPAHGWQLSEVSPPSTLFGANGIRIGPDGRLYVAQVHGSQINAIDLATGASEAISPIGGAIVAPDDIAFDSRGVMYVTEVMSARVRAVSPDGSKRIVCDNVPGANGITVHQDRIFMNECRPGGRLFEIFPDGREPVLLAAELPLPNALSVGPDGQLYYPLLATGEIWRIPTAGGEPELFVDGLAAPVAVKFDRSGLLTTVQAGSGEVAKFDLHSRAKTVVASLRPGLDNLDFDADGRLFVSYYSDGAVAEILPDGREHLIVEPGFVGPLGLTMAADGHLYAADGCSLVAISPDGERSRPGVFVQPGFPGFIRGLTVTPRGQLVVTTSAGSLARYDFQNQASTELATGFNELIGVASAPDGSFVVAEAGAGRVVEISETGEVSVLASDVGRPTDVAVTQDGTRVASDENGGRIVRIDGGSAATLVTGLTSPQGIAVTGSNVFVVDVATKEIILASLTTGESVVVATNVPVGAPPGVTPAPHPGVPDLFPGPLNPFAGLAIGDDGALYIGGNGDGSILKLERSIVRE